MTGHKMQIGTAEYLAGWELNKRCLNSICKGCGFDTSSICLSPLPGIAAVIFAGREVSLEP